VVGRMRGSFLDRAGPLAGHVWHRDIGRSGAHANATEFAGNPRIYFHGLLAIGAVPDRHADENGVVFRWNAGA